MSGELFAEVLLVTICLGMGGILKGATGAGAPILAVPALVLLFDMHFAILVMLIPNIVTNIFQVWKFRSSLPEVSFVAPLMLGGSIGILIGTYTLATLSSDVLSLFLAIAVFGYIAIRLGKPEWKIQMGAAKVLALPAGIGAGFLQGASGLSAPISITFLNAMRLPRPVFIVTISLLFTIFTVVQLLALWQGGLLRQDGMFFSMFAVIPISLAMPLGAHLAKKVKPQTFDRVILGLLALIAIRLLAGLLMN